MIALILLLVIETSYTEVITYGKFASTQNHARWSLLLIGHMSYGNAIFVFKMTSFWEKRLQSTQLTRMTGMMISVSPKGPVIMTQNVLGSMSLPAI